MSDPLANLEIQDVLSSIRRLISEDKRSGHRTEPTPAGKLVESAADDRLVLTSAHRIDTEQVNGADGGDAANSLEDTIAELEAAVAGIGGEFEPDGSEVARASHDGTDADLEAAFEDGFAVDFGSEPERRDSPFQSAVTSRHVDDGDGADDAVAGDDGQADAEADRVVLKPGDDPGDLADEAGSSAPEDDSDGNSEVAAAVTATPETAPDPDVAAPRRLNLSAADLVQAGAPWDRADAEARKPEEGMETSAAGPAEATTAADAMPDMKALQELVADIVRQELKGPLGERMTRNIRLLVRREINRALDSRDTH